jgi:hypothetical protein
MQRHSFIHLAANINNSKLFANGPFVANIADGLLVGILIHCHEQNALYNRFIQTSVDFVPNYDLGSSVDLYILEKRLLQVGA